MKYIISFSKSLSVLPALLALALVFSLGCGSGNQPARGAAQASDGQALPAVGNQVGQRIVPFSLRLGDGSIVTSADLLDQKRPTFLIYFKHP